MRQVVVLNAIIAALWPSIKMVGVQMILFCTVYLRISHEFHHRFKTCSVNTYYGILTCINDNGNSMTSRSICRFK